jgi:bzd-type benzoyl-CoA reductase N subunit
MARDQDSQHLTDFVAHPYRDWKARYPGRRAFGYLCTYAPLEMLHAAGFAPVRLMQLSGPVALANAHLPSFACAPARAVTERMLRGELDFLAGVLFAHTCDTMQCMADIWRLSGPRFKVIPFSLPTVLSNPDARAYLVAELRQLAAVLESEFGLPVTEDGLRASIALYNEQRRLLSTLYEQRGCFSAEHLWSLTVAGMLMPVEEHNAVLQSSLRGTEGIRCTGGQGPAVMLVGAVLDDPVIPQLTDELGGRVVGDDLCTGSRYFDTLVDETAEPFAALAERYLQRAPCPAKHNAANPRARRLLRLLRTNEAQGVIFVVPKFCEPHAFDYVSLAKALNEAGVPHLLIETEVTTPTGQLRTRLQAFIEMLQHSVA